MSQEDLIFEKLLKQADIDAKNEKVREQKRAETALKKLKDQLKKI